ncbi:GntR family transcriptional regulator [Telmatospirillum sp. J64-1]|uniref:GntR family transcriptional regulator n=1 Tax=Telmatospirillum sp. J64-1 TaxID=2502183 RepID=UPI00115CD0D3|nr:GntR family transcriptional regulator [Telmatospirillum sp. J64-1]
MSEDRPNRAAQVVRQLEHDIVTGALKPGDRLDERQLSERFGTSRTPVREALLQLMNSGLVSSIPRKGAVVAAVTVADLLEMFEVMAELESLCARLAARRMQPEEVAELERLHLACKRHLDAGDHDGYYLTNVAFHEAIYAGGRNSYLVRNTKQVRNRLSPYRRLQLYRKGRMASSNSEHDAIVAAIKAGDEDLAANIMRDHVTVQGQALNDLIAILPRTYLDERASA